MILREYSQSGHLATTVHVKHLTRILRRFAKALKAIDPVTRDRDSTSKVVFY